MSGSEVRGLHSFTSQLNPSRFRPMKPPDIPRRKCSRQAGKWTSVNPCPKYTFGPTTAASSYFQVPYFASPVVATVLNVFVDVSSIPTEPRVEGTK